MTGFPQYPPPPPQPPSQMRLGLWGPPNSGKTTFLAALPLAALRSQRLHGDGAWTVSGADDDTTNFILDSIHHLTDLKTFPLATEQHRSLMFDIAVDRTILHQPEPVKRGWSLRGGVQQAPIPATVTERFFLDVLDVPGRSYDRQDPPPTSAAANGNGGDPFDFDDGPDDSGHPYEDDDYDVPGSSEDELLDHLQMCQGILFLFDPGRDARQGDAFRFMYPVLEKLAQRVKAGGYSGARLPHRIAVCVTKLDDPFVYKTAYQGGFLTRDYRPPFAPTVPDERAPDFFARLCRSNGRTNSDLVLQGLNNFFYPHNIRFFVTSSVGFHIPNGMFKAKDPFNVWRGQADGKLKVRGTVSPINVLEPLIWLHESLRDQQ
ncbi:hypothetical protein [Nocardia salmonicida]|uniref:hypothetical protein n=1 Tax=Nocardia salmonicida TaxID=53431 RepID=UPI0033F164EE